MTEAEVKQNEKMNKLFERFDTDGSGALDMNEIFELFRQNEVELDMDTIKFMFNNQQFTLQNFKNINNSPRSLSSKLFRFFYCFRIQRLHEKMQKEIEDTDS